MKRFLIVAVVIFALPIVALAAVQEFERFKLNVPEDWTVEQGELSVMLLKNDGTASFTITLPEKQPGDSAENLAAVMSQALGGTMPEAGKDGVYTFTAQGGQIRVVIADEGAYYFVVSMFGPATESAAFDAILNSIEKK